MVDPNTKVDPVLEIYYPHKALKNKGIVDSGCSRHMTGNKAYLAKFQDFNGGPVAFGGRKGYITGKGKIKTGTEDIIDAGDSEKGDESAPDCFVLPIWSSYSSIITPDLKTDAKREGLREEEQVFLDELERLKRQEKDANKAAEALRKDTDSTPAKASSTNLVNTASTPVSTASPHDGLSLSDLTNPEQDDSEIPPLEDINQNSTDGIFTNSSYDDDGAVADFTNLETVVNISPIPTSRIISSHPSALILGDLTLAVQTRSKVNKSSGAHAFVSYKILEALEDKSWVDAMQDELLQFKIQKVWILVDLPFGKKAIGTKWVYRNKKDERGVFVINKARIEAIRIILVFASYMGFIVYQMDVKSAFLYGKIDEEVYVSQPPGFLDLKYPQKKDKHDIILVQVYVDDIIFGSTKKSWCDEFEALMKSRFQMSSMGELTFFLGLQVKQKEDGIFISQDKYVAEILKKFDFVNVKTASTLIETQKPLVKDEEASDVDVHLYRSMISSLMYLTASRPDIMFAVCACSRFQVTPKSSHLSAVKRIFRYLKGKPKLGLWYPRVSSFDLESYSDSDYAGANLDRKSTTGGCQFLGRRLISWQCKKQTIVATSTTEAEYVAAASCCGQVLWIQNQMLDYGFNFMNTKIYIDNESTICIVKNPVYHSKTKHIAIRHHFIRDAYEKKLIQVLKIHTDDNVADLLTKAFDVSSYPYESDLHFDDVDGIDSLNNQAIFDAIKLMGTVKRKNQNKKKVLKTSKRRSVFKQGRKTVKSSKGAPTVPTNTEWDDLDMDIDDTIDYTSCPQMKGKTDKLIKEREKVEEGTAEPEPRESTSSAAQTTPTPTPTTFGDDETIAQVLLNMSQAKAVSKEKEKGVEIRNAKNAERPRTTSTRSVLTLKPLPKIDPNDKGKKRIEEDEESDTESEEITEAKKKFDQIAHDEEVARKMQEEWEAEEERKRLTEEEATKTALSNEYDFIQARIEADRLLAERVQEAEREQFTVEERAKFLHDTIATQRRILAQQRSEAIRNKPPTKNQFRNQMMTYLKHVGNKKHVDLKTKSFDEIKALYEKVKRFDDSFITIGSTEDERKIKEMNEGASDPDKKKKIVKEDVSAKVPAKQDVAEQGTKKRKGGHMKMID
ncbi:putative ribonuclease H-like domain-containing protein [Tanacetum coccineum]|uniref:Ribonuclease H-like domain-containing protein n=1 Tax=Tanacetum coccineum TaxID=301880 RepID=A0ABQ4WJ84_9ASTR